MTKKELHTLLHLNVPEGGESVLVFATHSSERFSYTCRFIFNHVLGTNFRITKDPEEFAQYQSAKLAYHSEAVNTKVYIPANPFISETQVHKNFNPETGFANGNPVLFPFPQSVFGYDIFSAVFYFISLYQEWQNFKQDEHGRFELKASMQFRMNEHLNPLVNIWIDQLKKELLKHFPHFKFPEKKFRYISTIDVDNLYAYKNKGVVRTLMAAGKDLLRLDVKNFKARMKVVSGRAPDPFDVYDKLIQHSENTGVPLLFFFLQRSGTRFDRTIDPSNGAFREVFMQLKHKSIPIGLHPSYMSFKNPEWMKEEAELIRKESNTDVNISRQHYLRWDVSSTPTLLEDAGFIADFSMGFASGSGYRAMTFTPFYYFDLKNNKAGNILLVPFAAMDGAYFVYSKQSTAAAEEEMLQLASKVKLLGGIFITVFHERTFSNDLYPGFGDLYFRIQQKLRT